jgi:hypothetical protein
VIQTALALQFFEALCIDLGKSKPEDQNLEARDGIEPPARALQALPLAISGTAPSHMVQILFRRSFVLLAAGENR